MTEPTLSDSIRAVAEREQHIAALAKMIKAGQMPIDGLSSANRQAVQDHLASQQAGGMTPQQFHAKQEAERRKFFRERTAQGHTAHRVSQPDHDRIFNSILDSVDAGQKPAVRPMLKEHGEQHGYSPDWAENAATRHQPKRMARSLATHKNHTVLRDLKEGRMFSQTHKAALQNATYSGLAELLFSGSQTIRQHRQMQARLDALEAELATVKTAAARANARLDIKDAGQDWKEVVRITLAAEPTISKRELARRVGKSHTAVNKYLAELVA